MAGGAQQGVDRIAGVAEQVVAREPAVGLHVADGGLDGATPFEFAFHGRREAAAPAREEDTLGLVVVVTPVAPVGIEAFRFDPGDADDLGVGLGQGVAVVRGLSRILSAGGGRSDTLFI